MELISSIMGIQIPTLALIFLMAGIIQLPLNRVLSDLKVYEYVWHPGLFRTATFFCIFFAISLIIYK